MKVATNNTIKRASAKNGFEELNDTEGPCCIVFSNNESVDGPRIVSTFAKKNKKLVIKDGVVDGKYYDIDGIKVISSLPTKQTLIALVAGGLYQPIQQLALGLHQLAEKLEKTVKRTGKKIVLEPMPAYERKILHTSLQSSKFVTTYSIGEEPHRKLVIEKK